MDLLVLVVITFIAATVNGALGYGFSSITVPVALLFYTNKVLNPGLVLVEFVINSYVLFINRGSIPNIWRRVTPILIGLVIGVGIGSYILALVHPAWVFKENLLAKYEKQWQKVSGERGGFTEREEEEKYFAKGKEMLQRVVRHPGPISAHAPWTDPERW